MERNRICALPKSKLKSVLNRVILGSIFLFLNLEVASTTDWLRYAESSLAHKKAASENRTYDKKYEAREYSGYDKALGRVHGWCSSRNFRGYANQDRILAVSMQGKNTQLFGVFDGHGKNGDEVSDLIMRYMPEHIATYGPGNKACSAMNTHIKEKLGDRANYNGSTGTMVLVHELQGLEDTQKNIQKYGQETGIKSKNIKITLINLGDSRTVLGDIRGNLKYATRDHKPDDTHEHDRIKKFGGYIQWRGCWRLMGKIALSRGFGDLSVAHYGYSVEPDVITIKAQEDDFILLASDGVWDVITSQDAVMFVAEKLKMGISPEQAAQALVERVRNHTNDDVTALIICL